MKNIFLPKVTMCIIALFTLILPASAQNTNATDEYKETLKKINILSWSMLPGSAGPKSQG